MAEAATAEVKVEARERDAPHGNISLGFRPDKAYKDANFLNSKGARAIRILCEYQQPFDRFAEQNVKGTILFFGSARSKSREEWVQAKKDGEAAVAAATTEAAKTKAAENLTRVNATEWMVEWYDKVRELAKMCAEWCQVHIPDGNGSSSVVVCTGGGPGMMKAANQGARDVKGAKSMGMGISLPFEPRLNRFVDRELGFEFHYFFTRKFWMVYQCKSLIVAPGGVGTFDELFETMTLLQTGKISDTASFPIVLLCKKFWTTVVNWEALVQFGTIAQRDVDRLIFADSIDEAFQVITKHLQTQAMVKKGEPLVPTPPGSPSMRSAKPKVEPPTPPKI